MEPAPEQYDVIVDRVMFQSDDGNWTVVRVAKEEGGGRFIAAGRFPMELGEGDLIKIDGRFDDHPRYGSRFLISAARPCLPATKKGILRYLKSGRIKGVGPKLAQRLVDAFGEDTMRILEEEPRKVLDVPGVGKARYEELVGALSEGKDQREALVFLQGLGLGPAVSQEIWKMFGVDTLGRVQSNPFTLADDVAGVGFLTADRIASEMGVEAAAPERLRAGVRHILKKAMDQGHVCLYAPELITRSCELLGADEELVRGSLAAAVEIGDLIGERREDDEPRMYLPVLHAAEVEAHRRLVTLRDTPAERAAGHLPFDVGAGSTQLTDEQSEAVRRILESKVALLTGGPGVGKTTVLRAVVEAYGAGGFTVALASPTGRAARRLSEATQHEAHTLHKLFGIVPGAGSQGQKKILAQDVLVIDETSMLDLTLLVQILMRMPPTARLIMVGDPDQLPSVGPGSVLADLIACGNFTVAHLSQVFRQARDSQIIMNAHRINRGAAPEFPSKGDPGDCFFIPREHAEDGAELIRHLFCERMPSSFGLDPHRDIQVLCPMHRGATGTEAINSLLQGALSAGAQGIEHRGRTLHVGDRVMQTRNDYDLDVMNGDMGRVVSMDVEGRKVEATFDGRRVEFERQQLDYLEPAFAVTVHKSQGGEFPAVVIPLFGEHYMMLRRNVLYTAVTRARKVLVLVGSHRALHQAIRDDRMTRRGGGLRDRLEERSLSPVAPEALRIPN